MDKLLGNLYLRAEEGARHIRQLQEAADMYERGITSHDNRISKVETKNLALLRENEAMKTHILTLSNEIDTSRAARNRHSQYQFLTAGGRLALSVGANNQQATPMHVDLMRFFAYERASDGRGENGGGGVSARVRACGPSGDDSSIDDSDSDRRFCSDHQPPSSVQHGSI